jgi:hypothetical protein
MLEGENLTVRSKNLFSIIAHDVHFWIPLIVLLAGLLLLHELH